MVHGIFSVFEKLQELFVSKTFESLTRKPLCP
jgi:hypothetical protein